MIGHQMGRNDTVRWLAVFRTAIFAALFLGFFGVYLPRTLGLLSGGRPDGWRLLGSLPLCLGLLVALRCAFAFAWTGRGTPAPFDPPRGLVVTGLYRYVRNPMYFGMALLLIGEWLLWGSDLHGALIYFGVFAVSVTLFVIFCEERALRSKFGEEYAEYCRNVPRFVPRLRPWDPPKKRNAAQG